MNNVRTTHSPLPAPLFRDCPVAALPAGANAPAFQRTSSAVSMTRSNTGG